MLLPQAMTLDMSNSLTSWQKPLQMSQENMLNNWCIRFSQLKGTWKSCFYPWLQKCRISDNIKFCAQLNKDKSFPINIVDWESYEMINTVKIQWWCLRNICFTGKQSPMLYCLMQRPQLLGDASKIWSQGMKFHPRPPWLYKLCIKTTILFFFQYSFLPLSWLWFPRQDWAQIPGSQYVIFARKDTKRMKL